MKNSSPSLITIALMVKDESASMHATLLSFFNAGVRDFFVLDTGSSDNTVEITEDFFQQHHVTGYITQEPFIDFATSRNRTLALAEQHFPETVFFLMPDAEWYLYHPRTLFSFCEKEEHRDTPLYLVTIKMNALEFTAARLFRASQHIRFKGVVHEAPERPASVKVPDPVYFEVKPTSYGVEKSQRRWRQDVELLTKEFKKNQNDPRITFYLAQTFECLGELEKAYQFYQYREQLSGWDEENFITLFRLGCLAERLGPIERSSAWSTAMDYYLKAFSQRPHRIEPLVKIAEHYWPDNIQTCYLFIRHAYDIPYPKSDLLFIEKEMYDYTRYEIMSRAAWYMGEYALGEEATLLALKAHSEMEHLHKNLELYREKLVGIPDVLLAMKKQ